MTTLTAPVFAIQRSNERAFFDHGWLKTYHSFSFADYFDPNNENWGALRVFNDDTIAGGTGFPPHPHRDMEIVTYVLAGELAHQDSMDNSGIVGPGGVQFMSAGTGVRHSEYNNSAQEPLHLVQMWVLPGQLGTPPSYGQQGFSIEERRNRWLTIVSGEDEVEAPIRITQRATFKVARLEHTTLVHEFAPKRYGFLFVADGN
ncbi:MAG: pirin family protein, partial [Candidatus Eremiobacteraeota bacterium]|nr:pirin family protein [Candidatus Eremiobacteraeota bacterium]